MAYNHNHDCPFEAYITNLGKYNEGELVGQWVKFPTTPETLQEVMKQIGIGSENEFGSVYEEWFITDYDCYVDGISNVLGEYESLDELNYLASKIDEMSDHEFNQFQAAIEYGDYTGSVKDLINLSENLNCYDIYPNVNSHADLGYYHVHEIGGFDLEGMGTLADYIDYESFGRDIALNEAGHFTDQGYVVDGRDSFVEVYDGDREQIPEEYRLFVATQDTEHQQDDFDRDEHMLSRSMELAVEIDTIFRIHDIEYAHKFSDVHKQEISLHEHLYAGDTSTIKDALIKMGMERNLAEEITPIMAQLNDYEKEFCINTYPESDIPQKEEELRIVVVEPLKEPYITTIPSGLSAMQQAVGGMIAATYPFEDQVAIICNDEGKINGMKLNRSLRDEDGSTYDVVAGPFLVVGLSEENFSSLSPELAEKYVEHFKTPEMFMMMNDELVSIPAPIKEYQSPEVTPPQALPKDTESQISFYAAECMEFTSLGEFHENLTLSEAIAVYQDIPHDRMNGIKGIGFTLQDGSIYHNMEYGLIHGNTLDLNSLVDIAHFKESPLIREAVNQIIRELPELKIIDDENYLKSAEMALEDDYGMIDGIINNGPKEVVPLAPEKKTSIREKLTDAKKECADRKPNELKKPEKNTPEHDL